MLRHFHLKDIIIILYNKDYNNCIIMLLFGNEHVLFVSIWSVVYQLCIGDMLVVIIM